MVFTFGARSRLNLTQIHPLLVEAAQYAIANSKVDFGVYEGLRSIEAERANIANGTSKLRNPRDCMHCLQSDGFGHAVDLVPFVDGAYTWDWEKVYEIAAQMQQFCFKNNLTLRWGGVWDIPLNKLSMNLKREVEAYSIRKDGHPFLDGVHFELPNGNNATNDEANQQNVIS